MDADPQLHTLVSEEMSRQRQTLEMIASENFAPISVLQAQGSVLTNKYSEGYPGRRYYGGCAHIDEIECLAIDRARKLFSADHAVLLQLGAGAKKAPFLLCDQRYVPVLSGRLEYPANNHCIRIRVTIGKHRALPLPQ